MVGLQNEETYSTGTLVFMTDTLRETGYPDRFTEKNIIEKLPKTLAVYVKNNGWFISLPFNEDAVKF